MKPFFFLALSLVVATALIPASSFALIKLNLDYPEFGNITFKCEPLPAGKVCAQNPNALIKWIYYLIVGISGLAAFIMLVYGGVQWLTSGAIPSQAGEAKDKIKNAVLGLLLVLASFLIIQVINPELTILQLPGFDCPKGAVCGKGEVPVLVLRDVSLETTPPKLPATGADKDGVYLCREFQCACAAVCKQAINPDVPDPAVHDFLFVDPAIWGVSTGPGGPGLPDLGLWKDKVKSVAIKGDFNVLLADDPNYAGVVTCFTGSTGGRLSEFERNFPARDLWSQNGAMSVKILESGKCQNPGITLREEAHFWTNPTAFLFINKKQGEKGSLKDADYVRYQIPSAYTLGPLAGNVSGGTGDWRRSILVTPGSSAMRLYDKNDGVGPQICFTNTEDDLSLYSLDPTDLADGKIDNDMTDDINSIQAITDSGCTNPGVAEP